MVVGVAIINIPSFCSAVPGPQPEITARGFQFLLLDRASQVWFFVLQYLTQMEVKVNKLILWVRFEMGVVIGYITAKAQVRISFI